MNHSLRTADSALTHQLACGLSVGHHRGALPLTPEMCHSVHVAICLRGHARVEHAMGCLRQGMREMLTLLLDGDLPCGDASACAQFICLWLSPDSLVELAGARGETMLKSCRSRCAPCPIPVGPDILSCATRLVAGLENRNGCPLLRDAWSLELLSRVLALGGGPPRRMVLRADERGRIEQVRSLLLSDLSRPPAVEDLALAAGLNVFRLKQGFRILYGQTIHAFYQQERMQLAWTLIESGKMDVASAGEHVGYSNLSHFSDAFRRRFGLLPSELKRCAQLSQSCAATCNDDDQATTRESCLIIGRSS